MRLKWALGEQTRVHGVGNGAPWIGDKLQESFGEPGRYLLDFYLVSEYLATAAREYPECWRQRQQGRLLENKVAARLPDWPAVGRRKPTPKPG